ncbi:hypothetical protein [Burkholderia thailandensis]|nr:hypothetical protein [Burkholderia thailandensis]UCR75685.1 hypothetical protein BtTXDOH_36 [Burkholderia phage phiBt-TXDOH]MCS3393160.1 hypothetical protein [Burkholderia thailandensis]MCS6426266.1 hypothetical protein [Burkholderia thailandensis]MCS6456495.1 hypothetical protein [Burkholderia thailandensis]MCS6465410.1 hypothetical protein [Burkholderia thailandensis]
MNMLKVWVGAAVAVALFLWLCAQADEHEDVFEQTVPHLST